MDRPLATDDPLTLDALRRSSRRYAAGVAAAYVLLSSLYILLSGVLALSWTTSEAQLAAVERYKGLAFVGTTGVALFFLLWGLFGRLYRSSRDVVQHRAALAEADARALAGILASSVAHDVNNMLTVLHFCVEQVGVVGASEEARAAALARMEEALDRATSLVGRLRSGWRVAGETRETVDLVSVAHGVVEVVRTHRRLRGCRIEVLAQGPVRAAVVPSLVERSLLNFVLNAGEATGGTGRIEVRVAAEGDGAVIEVHDDGPGVPPAERERIFQALVTSKPDGTGLGLLSARVCAEVHGGEVRVGDSPMGGACFRLVLPGVLTRPAATS